MRGVRISGIDLDSDGRVAVEKLADIFEDGEVVGNSYLASSLRKSVEERGPTPLSTVIRRFNNGYFGAAWMYKGRVYIKEDSEAPEGARVREGPRGGRYYETKAGRGRPLGEAPKDWSPSAGERVRFRWPGDRFNGRLGRVTSITLAGDRTFAHVEGVGWQGGAYIPLDEGKLVPAPYTAKEKREMKAKDILIQEFGNIDLLSMDTDALTSLEYDLYTTEAGPNLRVKHKGEFDQPWMAQRDRAVSMRSFMYALPEMTTQALSHMKSEVNEIVFSPVGNPHDRETSARIGTIFISAASIDMKKRQMHIWPKSKESDPERLARTLTHETGHAVDDSRRELGIKYNGKRREFWDELEAQGQYMPPDTESIVAIEEEHGLPHGPHDWTNAYGRWKNVNFGIGMPNVMRFWPSLDEESTWKELGAEKQKILTESVSRAAPVSGYAKSNEKEYYAEAYTFYQQDKLPKGHIMQNHFDNLEKIKQWVAGWVAPREEVPWAAD